MGPLIFVERIKTSPKFYSPGRTGSQKPDFSQKYSVISNPLTSELLSLYSLSLCPLCPLWFNHSDTTTFDINAIKLMVSAIKNVLVVEKVVRVVNNLLFHLLFPLVQWESAAVPKLIASPKPIRIIKSCCFRL